MKDSPASLSSSLFDAKNQSSTQGGSLVFFDISKKFSTTAIFAPLESHSPSIFTGTSVSAQSELSRKAHPAPDQPTARLSSFFYCVIPSLFCLGVTSQTNFLLPGEGFGLNLDVIETNILNLGVVIGVVIYLGGDVLTSLLNERKEKILGTLKSANERFVDAEQKLALAKQKVQLAQGKALEIRAQGTVTARQTTATLAQRALEEIQSLEDGKQATLRFEEEKAMSQVRQQVVRLSLERAEQLIRTKMDASVQRRLIDANINLLGRL